MVKSSTTTFTVPIASQPLLVTLTVYSPFLSTLIACDVAEKLFGPVHKYVPVPLAVKVVEPTVQIVVLPVMLTVGFALMVNEAVAVPIDRKSVV